MPRKIKVTQDHIERGIQMAGAFCPIALAMREECPGMFISVGRFELLARQNNSIRWTPYPLPPEATAFIEGFDADGSGVPFEFELPDDIC